MIAGARTGVSGRLANHTGWVRVKQNRRIPTPVGVKGERSECRRGVQPNWAWAASWSSGKGDIAIFLSGLDNLGEGYSSLPLFWVEAVMPRTARSCPGGYTYHVLNRGNARTTVFHRSEDYDAFLELMAEASARVPMRVLAYCLMPNHFHLALWPREDGELSRWMHWLMTTHVRRHLMRYRSSGHVWQGRFKAFPAGR